MLPRPVVSRRVYRQQMLDELARVLLEQGPEILAELLSPAFVELGCAQLLLETDWIHSVEDQALFGQCLLQSFVLAGDGVPLLHGEVVQIARNDLLENVGEPVPGARRAVESAW